MLYCAGAGLQPHRKLLHILLQRVPGKWAESAAALGVIMGPRIEPFVFFFSYNNYFHVAINPIVKLNLYLLDRWNFSQEERAPFKCKSKLQNKLEHHYTYIIIIQGSPPTDPLVTPLIKKSKQEVSQCYFPVI